MQEVEQRMVELTGRLRETQEYNQYQHLLERVKEQPDLYQRIGQFRRQSLALRMSENGDKVQANNALQNEFRDLQNNGLASDFLVAEHQYCRMVQKLQEMFLEGARIETEFLDQ